MSSLFSGSQLGTTNFFSDYASIKNGSYAKLVKAYYGKQQSSGTASSGTKNNSGNILDKILEEKKNPTPSKQVQEANANLETGLSSLKSSMSALQNDKTYSDSDDGQSAEDKVVSAMKAYVTDYNNVVSSSKRSTMTNKTAYVANMMRSTKANADKLAEIGVTINKDGTILLNEKKLKSADISKVQDLFSAKDTMSYGSKVASNLKFAGAAASTSSTTNTDKTDSTDKNDKPDLSASSLKDDSKALASAELFEKIKGEDGSEKYDIDKIFAKAKSFVSNYNKMLDAAAFSTNSGVISNLSRIREKTASNANALKQFGISVDTKGKMKIDEDTFKASDMSQVQKFFKDYGSSISTSASLVDFYMTTQANTSKGYTAAGTYNVQGSSRYSDAI